MSDAAPPTVEHPPEAPTALVSFAQAITGLAEIPVTYSRRQEVLHPTREQYFSVAETLKGAGFITCSDLTAVDYLSAGQTRILPEGIRPERFELVVVVLSQVDRLRLRLRVQVPESDAVVPTLFYVYPGTENLEREVYDLFGIIFTGHPDLTRILMPEDWEGHPLRKDYGIGRVPVQFKDAPGPR